MNTAKVIDIHTSCRKPDLNTKVLLSDNFIMRMKQLDHSGLATLLQNAGILQQKVMPNIPVPILVESISRNNPMILGRIKEYLNSRNSSKYRMVCLEKGEGINSLPQKTFFYTKDPEGKVLKEIGEQFIPECITSYINGIRTEGIISMIEALYTTNILTLNSLSSTAEQVNKAAFIIQLIETTLDGSGSKKSETCYSVTGNIAVQDATRAKVFDFLGKRSATIGTGGKPSKPVLTSSGAYGKGTGKAPDNVRPIKFKGQQ